MSDVDLEKEYEKRGLLGIYRDNLVCACWHRANEHGKSGCSKCKCNTFEKLELGGL